MAINKPRYLRKADFLSYFDRPQQFWFLSNQELEGVFRGYFQTSKTEDKLEDQEINDAENDIDEFIEFDPIAFYQEAPEIQLTENSDPRVIEGQIIHEEFKKFLNRYCEQIFNVKKVMDFDKLYPADQYTLEERAQKTKEVFVDTVSPTLFLNPVFIYDCAVAIPTAIVFTNGGYEFFDVKGTTSTKRIDILDLYYQIKIIKQNVTLLRNAFLFLVAYELKPKFSISFTVCETVEITKTNKANPTETTKNAELSFYSPLLIREKQWIKKHGKLNIVDLVDGKYQQINLNNTKVPDHILAVKNIDKKSENPEKKLVRKSKKDDEFIEHLIELDNNFLKIIKQMHAYQGCQTITVPLSNSYDSYWKKFKYLNVVRKILGIDFEIFQYSGKLVKWNDALSFVDETSNKTDATFCNWIKWQLKEKNNAFLDLIKANWNNDETNLIDLLSSFKWDVKTTTKDWLKITNKLFWNYEGINYLVTDNAKQIIQSLKAKKIYFDFETINQALRVMDNSLPFMQVVTQCSILKDHGNGLEPDCENLIVDPKNINSDFFKKIIDALWVENADAYSYVVFNKSFEINRLKEMKAILNNPNYSKKINDIIDNVYDLADLFNVHNRNIIIEQLKGFHSIKVVLPLVSKKYLDITKTVSYYSLNVKRGDRAQALTSLRFFDVIDDERWKEIAHDLCLYCENDVRAMVAVELFAKDLINHYEDYQSNNLNMHQFIAAIIAAETNEQKEEIIRSLLSFLKSLPENERTQLLTSTN